jgi:hypothetical protein
MPEAVLEIAPELLLADGELVVSGAEQGRGLTRELLLAAFAADEGNGKEWRSERRLRFISAPTNDESIPPLR